MSEEPGEGRQAYLDGLERRLEGWSARIEALEALAADADPVSKAEFGERIDELWTRLDAARDGHAQLAAADEAAWAQCRRTLDQACGEVEDAYRDFERTLARA
jgi:hypothetical protein